MKEKVRKSVRGAIKAAHSYYRGLEQQYGYTFETFGEWKKANPNRRLASRNYPDGEYVVVINQWFNFFEQEYNTYKPILEEI